VRRIGKSSEPWSSSRAREKPGKEPRLSPKYLPVMTKKGMIALHG
jgi:hypothetical protein